MKPCAIARSAFFTFYAVQGCAPIYETRTTLVVSRQPVVAGNSPAVQRRTVVTGTTLDRDEVVVRVIERKICGRQIFERRVVEDRTERELDKPIFALEVTAAASLPVLALAEAAVDGGDSSNDSAAEDDYDRLAPVAGGALLVISGVALTAVIVDALAARDETKRRIETHLIGFAGEDCGASPAKGVPVELVLPDRFRLISKTDANGLARIRVAMDRPSWVAVVVDGKRAGHFFIGHTSSQEQPP